MNMCCECNKEMSSSLKGEVCSDERVLSDRKGFWCMNLVGYSPF